MKVYWYQLVQLSRKYHAFSLNAGTSACGHWFMGGACEAVNEYDESDGIDSKCKQCIAYLKKLRNV